MLFRALILAAFTATVCNAVGEEILSESLRAILPFPGTKRDIIIEMEPLLGDVLTNPAVSSLTGDSQKNRIIGLLKEKTRISQLPVTTALAKLGLAKNSKSFWIANRIHVKEADVGAIQALSKIPGLNYVIREPVKAKIYSDDEKHESLRRRNTRQADATVIQYGVKIIQAPEVWKLGNIGETIVVGIIDTGVNYNHIALKANYKNDNASWFDAFGVHKEPYDGNGHGTHCTGSICGSANGVGVAPGAKWIACRGLDDEGSGDEKTLLGCGEFMACPSGNSTGNCSGFPRVISNSWGGLVGGQDFYNPVINVWRSLGIIPVFALGNSGPICMTSGSPGDQPNLISVGATDLNDKIASFSSRGPAIKSRVNKPEVSAPGKDIISCAHDSNDKYRSLSGTSMACPHVAGAVALILAANPAADFQNVLDVLTETADQPSVPLWSGESLKTCSFPPNKYPNNGYGAGRINCLKAVQAIVKVTSTTTAKPTIPVVPPVIP